MAQQYRAVITKVMRLCVGTFETGQRDGSIRAELDPATNVYQIWGAILGLVILRAKATALGPTPPQADPTIWSQTAEEPPSPIDLESFVPSYVEQLLSLVENR
jgi:hypothetical protein